MTIHAWAAPKKRAALEPLEYEPPELGPHDVEIAISHCGICHSDVHLVAGPPFARCWSSPLATG